MNDIKYRHFNDIIVADANDLIKYIDKKTPTPTDLPIAYYETYDASKIISGYLTNFNSGSGRGLWYRDENNNPKKLFIIGEYPEGYITRITKVNNGINFAIQDLPTIRYKPALFSHTIMIHNSQVQEYMIFEMYWNTDTPPTINELTTSSQLLSNFGVSAFHLFKSGNDDILKSARFVFDGTNFVYWDDNTTIQVDWNPNDCLIASDDVVDLLNVNDVSKRTQRTQRTTNTLFKKKKE